MSDLYTHAPPLQTVLFVTSQSGGTCQSVCNMAVKWGCKSLGHFTSRGRGEVGVLGRGEGGGRKSLVRM